MNTPEQLIDIIIPNLNSASRDTKLRYTEIGNSRKSVDPNSGQIVPEIDLLDREVRSNFAKVFAQITGTKLYDPFEIWKADWLVGRLIIEKRIALNKFYGGQTEVANYIIVFDNMLSELLRRLYEYIGEKPEPITIEPTKPIDIGIPLMPTPITPTPVTPTPVVPINPGTPEPDPVKKTNWLIPAFGVAAALFFFNRK